MESSVRRLIVCALGIGCLLGAPARISAQEDVLARARALAAEGQRPAAIRMLRDRLAVVPDDGDARVLLGLVLSWEGQYEEARTQLRGVLDQSPAHGDALSALMNLEIWDGHPERADALGGPHTTPESRVDVTLFLGRARALAAMNRTDEARRLVRRVLEARPANEEARALVAAYDSGARRWQAQAGHAYDWFSEANRKPWREDWVSLKRETVVGSIIARMSRAERFGLEDRLFEVDLYPRFRPGTYAYVNVGLADDRALYPDYRAGFDLYQRLGRGFEASAGMRRLQFSESVNIYLASLSKYRGNWLFTGRTYVTPDTLGPSVSLHGIARRYFGAGGTSYAGLRLSHGRSKEEVRSVNDLALLDADSIAGEVDAWVRGRVEVNLQGSVSRRERVERTAMRHYSISATLGWRF